VTLREELEERERRTLSPHAALSSQTRGRLRPEPEHDYRVAFQRDRDRILHTKAFRRLKRKTQVFLAPEGDHYRTRLTHTLEASQIARTVARALYLNEDLTEAIALGHDLGHTPFGHGGEAGLNEVYPGGFRHAEQSLRVVDEIAAGRDGLGLNLTFEVRDGILHHSKGKDVLEGRGEKRAMTMEGQIVSACDAIAYINHDIDDAVRAGVITLDDLPADAVQVLGGTTSQRINTMVIGLIRGSADGAVGMVPEILGATNALRSFMYTTVYPCEAINGQVKKAKKLLMELYDYLIQHPQQLGPDAAESQSVERRTVDLLAGMTDQFALHLYEKIFFPSGWRT